MKSHNNVLIGTSAVLGISFFTALSSMFYSVLVARALNIDGFSLFAAYMAFGSVLQMGFLALQTNGVGQAARLGGIERARFDGFTRQVLMVGLSLASAVTLGLLVFWELFSLSKIEYVVFLVLLPIVLSATSAVYSRLLGARKAYLASAYNFAIVVVNVLLILGISSHTSSSLTVVFVIGLNLIVLSSAAALGILLKPPVGDLDALFSSSSIKIFLYMVGFWLLVYLDLLGVGLFRDKAQADEYALVGVLSKGAVFLFGAINTVFFIGLRAPQTRGATYKGVLRKTLAVTIGLGCIFVLGFTFFGKPIAEILFPFSSVPSVFIFFLSSVSLAPLLLLNWTLQLHHLKPTWLLSITFASLAIFGLTVSTIRQSVSETLVIQLVLGLVAISVSLMSLKSRKAG